MAFDTQRFIDGLHEYLQRAFAPINARHKELEARVDALELELRLTRLMAEDPDGDTHA